MENSKSRYVYLFGALLLFVVLVIYLTRSSNEPVELPTDGKPVVLYFYTDHCPACTTVKPHIEQAETVFGDRVHIVAVNLTTNRHPSVSELTEKFQVSAVPETFVLRGGDLERVVFLRGVFTWSQLSAALDKAIQLSARSL